ncbi:MAG: hypothetical protein ABI947_24850 [Chloroflexota bacterium]
MRKTTIALLVLTLLMISAAGVATITTSAAQATPVVTVIAPNPAIPETWTTTRIAQQDFQRGYMFWISTSESIWVLTKKNPTDNFGEWKVYKDTFVDGDPEIDPAIVPPDTTSIQPRRGFGKIWRDRTTGIAEALGWGTTPEFELLTPISYLSGINGGPGRYLIITLGKEVFSLSESTPGQTGGTWTLVGRMIPSNEFPTATAQATMAATP